MQPILQVLDILLPIAYAGVFGAYLTQFLRDESKFGSARYALWALLVLHAAYFVMRRFELGYFPLGSRAEFVSLASLSIATVYAFIEYTQKQTRTGVFFLAFSLVGQSVGSIFMTYESKHPLLLENPIYGVHALFLVLGVTALSVGALYALMYALMARQLKARDLGVFMKRLPALTSLERMSKAGTAAGIATFGFGIAMGYLVATQVEGFNFTDIKVIVTTVIWAGYAVGVGVWKVRGLSGMETAYATMGWFLVFLVSIGAASHQWA